MGQLASVINKATVNRTTLPAREFGDVNIFIGVNGSGKTTLLQVIYNQIAAASTKRLKVGCVDVEGLPIGPQGELYLSADVVADRMADTWVRAQAYNPAYVKAAIKLLTDTHSDVVNAFVFEDDEMMYADIACGNETRQVHVLDMGAGFFQLMKIITALYNSRDGFLIIDELGKGISITAAKAVSLFIMEQAKTLNVQVFIATHCPEFLTGFKSQSEEAAVSYKLFSVESIYRTADNIDVVAVNW